MYKQKDIVILPFPYSDLTGAKQRPALIISNEKLNNTQDRICCLITSNEPHDGMLIANSRIKQGFLPFKSWVKPHRLFSVNERIIKKKICEISGDFHNKIIARINEYVK
ncbi:type II toxin-antitoxin system PemK/MazF family toxin [Candidatus Woesearchaeota archaeon]|nr:type II toxin-antitoxin system PemK/MazF family toxin [Candidatus Woesearchaeota archaeon]